MAITLFDKKISESLPVSYNITQLDSIDFIKSFESFLYEHFRGATAVSTVSDCDGLIVVSANGLAHLVREVLVYIFGRSLLNVELRGEEFFFHVDLRFKGDEIPMEKKEYFMNIANRSAIELRFARGDGENRIMLKMRVEKTEYLPIYARRFLRLYSSFNQVFFLEY